LNKPLFRSSRTIQTTPHARKSKKVLAGLFSIALILLPSLAVLKMPPQVHAETPIPTPAVPEFTVKLIDSSYDEPTTYSIDPYTGENVTHVGYHVESRTIELSIKNQPFTPFQVEDEKGNNWTVSLQYNIRWKGHFEQDWHEIYYPSDGFTRANLESEYTVRSFEGEYSSLDGLKLTHQGMYTTFPPDAQVDFQVKAMIGYVHREISIPVPGTGWVFTGETSDWSSTQTITIGEGQSPTPTPAATPTPTPNQEPQQTEQEIIIGAAITAAVIVAGLGFLIYLIKRK
jgi:hypothetical protein